MHACNTFYSWNAITLKSWKWLFKKKAKKKEYSQHNKYTNMVTNLNAMSFGSFSSIPFTTPVSIFISSSVQVVEVRSVMVGWFVRIVCHQICMH